MEDKWLPCTGDLEAEEDDHQAGAEQDHGQGQGQEGGEDHHCFNDRNVPKILGTLMGQPYVFFEEGVSHLA